MAGAALGSPSVAAPQSAEAHFPRGGRDSWFLYFCMTLQMHVAESIQISMCMRRRFAATGRFLIGSKHDCSTTHWKHENNSTLSHKSISTLRYVNRICCIVTCGTLCVEHEHVQFLVLELVFQRLDLLRYSLLQRRKKLHTTSTCARFPQFAYILCVVDSCVGRFT